MIQNWSSMVLFAPFSVSVFVRKVLARPFCMCARHGRLFCRPRGRTKKKICCGRPIDWFVSWFWIHVSCNTIWALFGQLSMETLNIFENQSLIVPCFFPIWNMKIFYPYIVWWPEDTPQLSIPIRFMAERPWKFHDRKKSFSASLGSKLQTSK